MNSGRAIRRRSAVLALGLGLPLINGLILTNKTVEKKSGGLPGSEIFLSLPLTKMMLTNLNIIELEQYV